MTRLTESTSPYRAMVLFVIPLHRDATDPPPVTYVCGARDEACVCIDNHATNPSTDLSTTSHHVCYQCGHEWKEEQ